MSLPAHKQPKNFWRGGRNGAQNSLDWAKIMKRELKKDPAYLDQVISSDEYMLL
jgi:hypothetical protein